MRARFPIREHDTKVHYGDWHAFAVCRTCGWEGDRSYVDSYRINHQRLADQHAASARRAQIKANRWWRRLFAKDTTPVVHLVGRYVGDPTLCCHLAPEVVPPWDDTSSDPALATCPIGVRA